MSQNDLVIANQSAPDFRADLNDALQALASLNSGSTAPSTTYANMLWYDTSNNILKMRSEADDAWIDIGTLNQSTNEFEVANLTELTETQAEDDTSTVFGLVSGERLAQAVAANETAISGITPSDLVSPTAGDTAQIARSDTSGDGNTYIPAISYGCVQSGTVRAYLEEVSNADNLRVRRLRGGSYTTLGSTTSATLTVDAAIESGDLLLLEGTGGGAGAGASDGTFNAEIRTGGESLWPSADTYGYFE